MALIKNTRATIIKVTIDFVLEIFLYCNSIATAIPKENNSNASAIANKIPSFFPAKKPMPNNNPSIKMSTATGISSVNGNLFSSSLEPSLFFSFRYLSNDYHYNKSCNETCNNLKRRMLFHYIWQQFYTKNGEDNPRCEMKNEATNITGRFCNHSNDATCNHHNKRYRRKSNNFFE